jgi:predicted DNA-binding transcriptional regulator AlpA
MRFIGIDEVLDLVGVSRSTLWRMVRTGTFPKRVEMSPGRRGHVYEDVIAWIEARARGERLGSGMASSEQRGRKRPGARDLG